MPFGGGWFAADGRSREVELEKIFFEFDDSFVGEEILPNEKGECEALLLSFVTPSLNESLPLSPKTFGLLFSDAEDVENYKLC